MQTMGENENRDNKCLPGFSEKFRDLSNCEESGGWYVEALLTSKGVSMLQLQRFGLHKNIFFTSLPFFHLPLWDTFHRGRFCRQYAPFSAGNSVVTVKCVRGN